MTPPYFSKKNSTDMDDSAKLNSIRMAIGQGELERALDEFVAFLDSDDKFSELLNTVRINQGNFQETKNQLLKGTISVAEARQSNNQVTDNLLNIAEMVERGELGFSKKISGEAVKKIRWQYFVIGGLVALVGAFLVWKYLSLNEKKCPTWKNGADLKVMILPFKTLGKMDGKIEPEIDLQDELDKIAGDNGIDADVRANQQFDIEALYPNSNEALAIAKDCDAEMIIWGKINQKTADSYSFDVKYKLLDVGGVKITGDTSITRLISSAGEGGFSEDIERVSRFLFVVIANRLQRSDVALKIMERTLSERVDTGATIRSQTLAAADTSLHLQMAYTFAKTGKPKKAVEEYSKVLEVAPQNWTAMQNRGIAKFEAKDFEGAAIDLETAQSVSNVRPTADLLKIQAESNLNSNRLEAAKTALDDYQKTRGSVDKWTVEKKSEYDKRLATAEAERKKSELAANQKPNDTRANLRAANSNLKLGNSVKATQFADRTLKKNPKNVEAWAVKIEAANHEDGAEAAQKVVEEAEAKGVQAKDIVKFRPVIAPLIIEKKQE